MYRISLFGSVSLEGPSGPVSGAVSQRRPLALLSLLGVAEGGILSRDKVIALLWPESETERARHLLSVALHTVRKALGRESIGSVGDDLRLNPELVQCDVAEFQVALRKGEWIRAAELYSGALLDGFHVTGAPGFERWLDRERERLTREYSHVLESLAEQAEAEGDLRGAARWWRELAVHDPYSSRIVIKLMRALDAVGDRPRALQHARIHTQRVRGELGLEPDPEVAALEEQLETGAVERAPLLTRDSAPLNTSLPDATRRVQTQPEAEGHRDEGHRGGRSRLGRRSFAAVGVVAVALLGLWALSRQAAVTAEPPPRVTVLPFEVHGATDVEYLGEAMSHLLSIALDGALELRVVDPHAFLGAVVQEWERVDLQAAEAISARFGANLFVLGDVFASEQGLLINASMYRSGESSTLLGRVTTEGAESELLALVDELTSGILLEYAGRANFQVDRVAARTTSSQTALRAYLRGERQLREGDPPEAIRQFRQAIEEDSLFALAYYRLATAAFQPFSMKTARAAGAVLETFPLSESFPRRTRSLIRAQAALLRGDADSAERALGPVISTWPHDAEAWRMLGMTRFYLNPLRGRSITEAKEPLERALSLEPDRIVIVGNLLDIARLVQDRAAVDSLWPRIHGGGGTTTARVVRALALGDRESWEQILSVLPATSDGELVATLWQTLRRTRNLEGAERIARILMDPERSTQARVFGHVSLAHIYLAAGRWRDATAALDSLTRLDSGLAAMFRGVLAASPFLSVEAEQLKGVRDELLAVPPHPPVSEDEASPGIFYVSESMRSHGKAYTLGLLSARLGAVASAAEYAEELAAYGAPEETQNLFPTLARGIEASLAARADRVEEVVEILQREPFRVPWELATGSPLCSVVLERFLLAEGLVATGRDEEALGWYRSLTEQSAYDIIYSAYADLRQGEILDRQGQLADAAHHYREFVSLWAHADPELQPQVRAVQRRLEEMQAERG